jgi:hypothetical protein
MMSIGVRIARIVDGVMCVGKVEAKLKRGVEGGEFVLLFEVAS